jgi:diacylglycerol kinase (ATP)
MKLIVIHNPTAGAGEWRVRDIEKLLSGAGHSIHLASTKEEEWWDLMEEEPDAFVACGGDGTVHKVAFALEGRDVPLAIIPAGTANNVAHSLGYRPDHDLARRVAHWESSEQLLHLALVEHDDRRRMFFESGGFGVFADMIHREDGRDRSGSPAKTLKAVRRRLARDLREAEPLRLAVDIDGITATGDYLLLECLNLPFYGPRLHVAPDQSPGAPAVTVCGVRVEQREAATEWIARGGATRDLVVGRGSVVRITGEGTAHVDGNPWPSEREPVDGLTVRAGALGVRLWV